MGYRATSARLNPAWRKYVRIVPCLVLLAGVMGVPLQAQDTAVPASVPRASFEIRTASAFLVYSNVPPNGAVIQPSTTYPATTSYGGSAQVEWERLSERSSFSLSYTPSYIGWTRYSSLSAFNHTASLNFSRKIAPRWTLAFSLAGDYSSQTQSIFAPTTLGDIASVPSNFNDLTSALLASKFTNTQLGQILTSAPLVDSPVRNLLYGQRMFTTAVQTSLSYSYSPRLTITVNGSANRSQNVDDSQSVTPNSLLANTTSGSAGFTASYSWSPRTQVSGTIATSRTSSQLSDQQSTTSVVTVGRTLGTHWFAQIHGGVGVINSLRPVPNTVPPSATPRPVAGGSLGFKTLSHTLLGSYDRTVSDSYGLGATSTSSASATWRWSRRASGWALESGVSWQQLRGNPLTDTSGWRSTVSFDRALGEHLGVRTEYAYLNYSATLQRRGAGLSQSAVRGSILWFPHPRATP